jgi:glycosyltransferase involved in cell wall biosynthesis
MANNINKKKISVCIATFNGERYIHEQLTSILSQIDNDDEVVVSDDSSTDNTIEIINSLNDHRIKIFPDQKFRNPLQNFENALRHVTGHIIFLSDQDDVALPGKIDKMLFALQSANLVVSNCEVVDSKLDALHESFFLLQKSGPGLLKNLIKNTYLGCCMAFDRTVLEASLPFPQGIPMHDWWIGLVGELVGKCVFIEDPLTLYRRHGNNTSRATEKSSASTMTKLKWRYCLVKSLIQRKAQIQRIPRC